MTVRATRIPFPVAGGRRLGAPLGLGVATIYLSLVVLIPLAAIVARSQEGGWSGFWDAITAPQAEAALGLTLGVAVVVCLINAVMGTIIAWVLVRDRFPGRGVVNSLIDLPFALPTIVAGLTLLALYGPKSPLGVNVAFTRAGIVLALLLVSLPFVVRSVQPVLIELDLEMEEAAASLGAGPLQTFRHVIFPALLPAVLGGSGLAFARALGEFGAIALIAGNVPFDTELASVYIYGQIESDRPVSAAAVSVALLVLSLAALLILSALERFAARHARD